MATVTRGGTPREQNSPAEVACLGRYLPYSIPAARAHWEILFAPTERVLSRLKPPPGSAAFAATLAAGGLWGSPTPSPH